MKEIEDNSCVKFRAANVEDKDWVDIVDTDLGCFASLGFFGPGFGKHKCNLMGTQADGSTCVATDIIIHELLHNLGVSHEQVRPDRDDYMTINWPKMQVPIIFVDFLIVILMLKNFSFPKSSIISKGH